MSAVAAALPALATPDALENVPTGALTGLADALEAFCRLIGTDDAEGFVIELERVVEPALEAGVHVIDAELRRRSAIAL